MNDIERTNDIFVSTLLNGVLDPISLRSNNITALNTGFYAPEFYKETPFVQKLFSDEKGNFNEEAFNLAYLQAAHLYLDLITADTYNKLEEFIEYNTNDIFAPLGAKTYEPKYQINKIKNPTGVSEGVSSIFGKGVSDKSIRELAQQSLIWDTENQKWLDQTADERGILGSIFGQSLVYATWDEDGEHEDPVTGRKIRHKKGEWKLNLNGQYYTETIGNRSGAGKQFVAASDTLTSENSALNKIDFFDSDGLSKSVAGVTFKMAAKIFPYLFPYINVAWGGITAVVGMASVLPKFAKALEGIVVGGDTDDETSFTKAMNRWENYFSKFTESYADEDLGSNWGYAQIASQASDIFAQLYQMRAAASLSRLFINDPAKKALFKFEKEFLPRYAYTNGIKELGEKEFKNIAESVVSKLPEVKKAIETQSKLSKSLSLGYMALTQSSDVYQDALNGGYDRRMAGLASLLATVGQYGIMRNNPMGDWFLDKTTGYSLNTNRGLMKKALREYYDDIAKAVGEIEGEATSEGKTAVLSKIYKKVGKGLAGTFSRIKDGTEPFWKNAIVEGVEEMTEEAVMDASKAIFDTMSWLGIGPNSDTASFGVLEDFTSGNFLERYALNAFGGFMGGALFEFQQKKLEPWVMSALLGKESPEIQPSLVHMIANGDTKELLEMTKELAKADNEVMDTPIEIGGEMVGITARNGSYTRGLAAASILQNYIQTLEGIIVDEGADLTDSLVLEKAIRDNKVIQLLQDSKVSKLLINDFTQLSSDIAKLRLEIEGRKNSDKEKSNKKEVEKDTDKKELESSPKLSKEEIDDILNFGISPDSYNKYNTEVLEALLKRKREQLKDFTSGRNGEKYLQKSLALLGPGIKESVGFLNKSMYTRIKYGRKYEDLTLDKGFINKNSIDKEYEDWKNESDIEEKFIKLGVETYEDFRKKFQQSIKDQIESGYLDIREDSITKILSVEKNPNKEDYLKYGYLNLINEDEGYKNLKGISESLRSDGFSGITLEDIFGQDSLKLNNSVRQILDDNPEIVSLFNRMGISKFLILEELTKTISGVLSTLSILDLEGTTLERIVRLSLENLAKTFYTSLLKENQSVNDFRNELINKGIIPSPQLILSLEQLLSTDSDIKEAIFNSAIADIEIKNKYNIGLSSSILSNYISSRDTLDAEVVRRILLDTLRQLLLQSLVIKLNIKLPFAFAIGYNNPSPDINLLSDDSVKQLYDRINSEFSAKTLEEIIDEWMNSIVESDSFFKFDDILSELKTQGYILTAPGFTDSIDVSTGTDEEIIDRIRLATISEIKKQTLKILSESPIYKLYKLTSGKNTKQNLIYNTLRNLDFELSDGVNAKVIDILEEQHDKIRNIERFSDYMPRGKELDSLKTIDLLLELYKTIAINMSNSPLSWENPINYNKQMLDFLKKWRKSSSNTYDTVDPSGVAGVIIDLNLLLEKVLGYIALADRSAITNQQLDDTVRKQYSKLLLDYIKREGSKLTIDGISIAPSDLDLSKYSNPDEELAFIQSVIYRKFIDNFLTDNTKSDAIKKLILQLNLDKNLILSRSGGPSNLDGELDSLNSWDLLTFFASALSADHLEFLSKYQEHIVKEESNGQVPLFSQELAMWQAYAFTLDKRGKSSKKTIHQLFFDALEIPEDSEVLPYATLFFIDGIGGAGKTMVAGSSVAALNSGKLIYVAAPTEKQSTKYLDSVKKYSTEPDLIQGGTVLDLIGKFLTVDGRNRLKRHIDFLNSGKDDRELKTKYIKWCNSESKDSDGKLIKKIEKPIFDVINIGEEAVTYKLNPENIDDLIYKRDLDKDTIPEIVLLDETTLIDEPYLQLIGILGDKFDIKIILTGDSYLKGKSFVGDTLSFNEILPWKSSRLNISIRSSNNQKSSNNKNFIKILREWGKINVPTTSSEVRNLLYDNFVKTAPLEISYFENSNTFAGDKFVDSLSGQVDTLKKILESSKKDGQKVGIITKLDESGSPIDTDLINTLKDAGFNSDDYILYSPDDDNKLFVLGAEADYFIVNGDFSWSNLNGENLRSIYTYAGRSLKGTLFVCPTNKLNEVGIINIKNTRTQEDPIPQLNNIKKFKDKRNQSLKTLLEGLNYDIEVKKTKTKKDKDNKLIPIRSESLEEFKKDSDKKEIKNKKSSSGESSDIEEDLSESERAIILQALTSDPDDDELTESDMTMTNSEDEMKRTAIPSESKEDTSGFASVDHFGISDERDSGGYIIGSDSGINFDLDGLLLPGWGINQLVLRGFLKFRNAISLAKNKSDIVKAIRNDSEIAEFLKEANPLAYKNQGVLKSSLDADTVSSRMANWAENHLSIDDNLYVFAKKWDYDTDFPRTILNSTKDKSIEDGRPGLFYGIHLKSDDGIINLWISLGALPRRYYYDNLGRAVEIGNELLRHIYDLATEKINGETDSKFLVFKLPNSNIYDLEAKSLMYFRKSDEDAEFFETLKLMEQRGLIIDEDNIFLVDSSKIKVNGSEEYKALVYLAGLDSEVLAPLLSEDNSKLKMHNILSFDEKLSKLKLRFIRDDGSLRIAGLYLTFANFSPQGVESGEVFRRAVLLQSKLNSAKDILESLKFNKDATDFRWVSKLYKCRPFSQAGIITDILLLTLAFKSPEMLLLHLVYLKDYVISKNYEDGVPKSSLIKSAVDNIDLLIDWVMEAYKRGDQISPLDFERKVIDIKDRVLLYPFFRAFITYTPDGQYFIKDITSMTVVRDGDKIKSITSGGKLENELGKISLNLDNIRDGYSSLPLVNAYNGLDKESDLFIEFFKDSPIKLDPVDNGDLGLYKVSVNGIDFRNAVGFRRYQLQMPTFRITSKMLSDPEEVNSNLEQIDKSDIWEHKLKVLPVEPNGYDYTKYSPKKLKKEDYTVDYKFKRDYTIEEKPKNDKSRTKEISFNKWYFDKKSGKRRYSIVKRKIHVKPESTFKYVLPASEGKTRIAAWVVDDRGFEVRVGDRVLLYGDTSVSYEIAGIDRTNGINLILDMAYSSDGKGIGSRLHSDHSGEKVNIHAVTAVVHRKIPATYSYRTDTYYTGKFKKSEVGSFISTGLNLDEYNAVKESKELFDFDLYLAVIIPFTEDDYNSGKYRTPVYKRRELQIRSEIVSSLPELELKIEELQENNKVIGVTIYKLDKNYNKSNPYEWYNNWEKYALEGENMFALTGVKSKSYLKRIIFFDDDIYSNFKKAKTPTSESGIDYSTNELNTSFDSPETKVELAFAIARGDLSEKESGFVELPESEFKEIGSKLKTLLSKGKLVIVPIKKSGLNYYRIYPTIKFYLGKDAPSDGINLETFIKYIISDILSLSPEELNRKFSEFKDYTFVTYGKNSKSKEGVDSSIIDTPYGTSTIAGFTWTTNSSGQLQPEIIITREKARAIEQSTINFIEFLIGLNSKYRLTGKKSLEETSAEEPEENNTDKSNSLEKETDSIVDKKDNNEIDNFINNYLDFQILDETIRKDNSQGISIRNNAESFIERKDITDKLKDKLLNIINHITEQLDKPRSNKLELSEKTSERLEIISKLSDNLLNYAGDRQNISDILESATKDQLNLMYTNLRNPEALDEKVFDGNEKLKQVWKNFTESC